MDEVKNDIEEYHQLLRTVFDAHLEQRSTGGLEPSECLLPYDFKEEINARQWSFPRGKRVEEELRELTNELNRWHDVLRRWYVWNKVIQPYNTDKVKAWRLRIEFLEPLVFYCLFQPASSRDRFTYVVTNAMHQVRLMIDGDHKDYLKGDPKTPDKITNPEYLSRRKKENRLSVLLSFWPEGEEFMELLRTIDDKDYKKETSNYRNLHSHTIGPRLGIGHVRSVVRVLEESTTFIEQPNGTSVRTPTGKIGVGYGFGQGIPPLDLEKAHAANLEQYRRARKCYESYRKLLATGLEAMPLAS
ncbi:hypothetical protein VU04_02805 [Desulfobulbus sp. TB]|nr:hypothetical protein [Desulfobulbus sp. TB]